jgi:hypothetical protein
MSLVENFERQRLLRDIKEKEPRFLDTNDFGT